MDISGGGIGAREGACGEATSLTKTFDALCLFQSVKIGSNDDIIAKLRYQPAISELVIEKKIRQVVDDEIIDIIKYKNK